MVDERPGAMQIGRVLKDARRRAGLDIRTVEERTKIRTKYLRALEGEEWDALPNDAYAKGFLRTYAQLLGIDSDALVDEYRRQVEGSHEARSYPRPDQVLERRRRLAPLDRERRPRWPWIVAVAAGAVVAVLLVLGLTGGEDDQAGRQPAQRPAKEREQERRREQRRERRREARERARADAARAPVELELAIESALAVCLLDGEGRELIDGQVLPAGSTERFEGSRFELRFPSGYDREFFVLRLDGERVRVPETQGPAAFAVRAPDRVRRRPAPGTSCP